jgi:hypothetical protein
MLCYVVYNPHPNWIFFYEAQLHNIVEVLKELVFLQFHLLQKQQSIQIITPVPTVISGFIPVELDI